MPSKDTISYRLTIPTYDELERIRKAMAEDLGIGIEDVTKKHAEIALRIKASHGKISIKEINEILLGKIK